MSAIMDVRSTLGAVFIGCLFSVAYVEPPPVFLLAPPDPASSSRKSLSAVLGIQTFMFFRMYPHDLPRIKLMVIAVWALDAVHTSLMCISAWHYLVLNFGDANIVDNIPITLACTVAFTAIITFIVHLFFAHRVLRLSKGNWVLTTPLIVLTFMRLVAALVSTVEMSRLQSFHNFTDKVGWVFTLGLSISSALDILIASSLCFYLHANRTGFGSMDQVIDVIMLYTLNNGALTCITTVISMICWLTMSDNLIWLGLHFAISKLYANSLLTTLNTRRSLRGRTEPSDSDHPLPVLFPSSFSRRSRVNDRFRTTEQGEGAGATKLQISVEKTVQFDVSEPELEHGADGQPSDAHSHPH
ncbi:hypothetical protein HETIRDRAFT_468070 [Heterobasidion irregulare TC 32-1]|uniref:DUF6534 domain-containing protein n=1 Tax=Heterobasidion irregulare (strain TC 32-1) TaxID=747525 RepID=W4KL42_HETIT|nr:uncharacterized protein HETIRDRAFT_468070 [Heterobasidion irregulare TC 32-1]ETW86414.1 hypothetical protein HETIRDRAFT_468070 [Heterobasidion irregulare TC 32-1]